MNPLIPAAVIGGAAYLVIDDGREPQQGAKPTAPLPGQTLEQIASGTVRRSTTAQYTPVVVSRRILQLQATARPQASSVGFADPLSSPMGPGGGAPVDPELQKKLDELEKYAEKTYNDMDEVARAEAVDKLNKELEIDPPIEYGSDWKTIAAAAGGYAGAAAGAAICGPICGKVGALVGAYLGAEIHDLISKNWDEMKQWCEDKWGELRDQIEETYEDVKDAAEDAYDEVAGLVSF